MVTGALHNCERPMLHIRLYHRIVEAATNQTLSIEHRVVRIHCHLIFRGISDKTFSVVECHIGWCGAISLIVRDNFHFIVLPHADSNGLTWRDFIRVSEMSLNC